MEFFKLFLTENFSEEKRNMLKCITKTQYVYLQSLVDKILYNKIKISSQDLMKLKKQKEILRTISKKKFSHFLGYYLICHIDVVKNIVKIAFKENESHTSTGVGSSRNMEKTKSKRTRKPKEDSDSEPSSPDTDTEPEPEAEPEPETEPQPGHDEEEDEEEDDGCSSKSCNSSTENSD